MTSDDLTLLRQDLSKLNKEILTLFNLRTLKVAEIQNLKLDQGLSLWSPEQEYILFKDLVESLNPSVNQCLLISLTIEEQSLEGYPRWSQGAHLEHEPSTLMELINPILLFVKSKSEYQKLKLKTEIKKQIEGLS